MSTPGDYLERTVEEAVDQESGRMKVRGYVLGQRLSQGRLEVEVVDSQGRDIITAISERSSPNRWDVEEQLWLKQVPFGPDYDAGRQVTVYGSKVGGRMTLDFIDLWGKLTSL